MRLKVKDQIQAFNYLVQEQATILNPRGGMYNYNQNPPFNSPSAQMSPHPQSPRKYTIDISYTTAIGTPWDGTIQRRVTFLRVTFISKMALL